MPFTRIHETLMPIPDVRPADVPVETNRPVVADAGHSATAIHSDAPFDGAGWHPETAAGRPSWPPDCAHAAIPSEYQTTGSPGVFVDRKRGTLFVVHEGNAYAVVYDKDNGSWRIVDPANGTRPSYLVERNPVTGRWTVHDRTGLKGGGGDSQRPDLSFSQQDNSLQEQEHNLLQQQQQLEQRQGELMQRYGVVDLQFRELELTNDALLLEAHKMDVNLHRKRGRLEEIERLGDTGDQRARKQALQATIGQLEREIADRRNQQCAVQLNRDNAYRVREEVYEELQQRVRPVLNQIPQQLAIVRNMMQPQQGNL